MPVALMVMWLNGWKPLILSHHAANFGGFKYCGSGDNTFLICHKISQCHIVKGSFNPPKSGCHRHCGTGNAFNLSRDHVRPCDRKVMWLYGWELLIISLSHGLLICHRTSHDHVVVKGVFFLFWVKVPHSKSKPYQFWWRKALQQWRYNRFNLLHDLPRLHDQRVI